MKCPLFETGWQRPGLIESLPPRECIEEDCAWWDYTTKRCIAQNISEKMSMIYVELTGIRTQGEGR